MMQDMEPALHDIDPTNDFVANTFNTDTKDKAVEYKTRFKPAVREVIRQGDMFKTRRPVSLEAHDTHYYNQYEDNTSTFEIVGHQPVSGLTDIKTKTSCVLPSIPTSASVDTTRTSSDTKHALDHSESTRPLQESVRSESPVPAEIIQTQGYVPGVDSHVTIRQPYVMTDGINPLIKIAFQLTPIETDSEPQAKSEESKINSKHSLNMDSDKTNIIGDDMSDPNYAISTFPPIVNDEINKHERLNNEAVKNSRNKPHAYQDYIRKLSVQKRLLEKPKPSDQKHIKRKNKKLQLKTKQRDTREDLFADKPETPKPKEEVIKPMKVIQSFRYSRAISEYYKGQMQSTHSLTSLDGGETVNSEEENEVINGWLVKTLGPQVLNMCARSLPSCNPIELRLRRQHARMHALDHAKLSKRSSNLSRGSSQLLSRSHDSYMFHGQGHESVHSNKSINEETIVISSPTFGQPSKGRLLPDIPEVRIEKVNNKLLKTESGNVNSKTTKIVLSLPMLTSEV